MPHCRTLPGGILVQCKSDLSLSLDPSAYRSPLGMLYLTLQKTMARPSFDLHLRILCSLALGTYPCL